MDRINIDKVVRSARKSYSIEINSEGLVIVRAPLKSTAAEIQAIVARKADWIREKQAAIREKIKSLGKKSYAHGEKFLFKGAWYPLVLRDDIGYIFAFKDGEFNLNSKYAPHGKYVFEHWYKRVAKGVIHERAGHYSAVMGLKFNRLRITSAETRWGSCSGRKNINFTWRLVMAPVEVIDYVVVHEIAHLAQMNHSKNFWAIVQKFMPDYKQRRRWLKDNGHFLEI